MGKKILVGTGKGLVVFEKKDQVWQIDKVHFAGMPVSYVYFDELKNAWWVSLAHRHWGQKLQYTLDEGKTWINIAPPSYPKGTKLSSGKLASLKKIWSINNAGKDRKEGVWIGTEPGGLFYSDNYGKSFQLVEGLWNHPSRKNRGQWFGAGRDEPFIHSIVVNPLNSDHVYIAVSCAGVFETKDGGATWNPKNKGLIAAYLPNPNVEVGHDPHLLLACPKEPEILWQQNHCGIFRSENGGELWENITGKDGFPNYGFGIAIDPTNSKRAWVIPAQSDEQRIPHDLALCVCETKDGGKTWNTLRNGLPQENCFDLIFRHSFSYDGETLAFGTNNGNLYLSENQGQTWQCIYTNLPRVDCISFTH